MKYFRYLIVLFFAFVFVNPVFAQKYETTISTLMVNNSDSYDIELMLYDTELLLPFKQIADVFGVEYKTNHTNNDIEFVYNNKKGLISKNKILYDGKIISNKVNKYQKIGLIDGVKDEIYCHSKDMEIIFGSKFICDLDTLSLTLLSDKIQTESIFEPNQSNKKIIKAIAYTNLVSPKLKSKITVDSISVNNNTVSDTLSQYMQHHSQKSVFFNNNSNILVEGKIYNGNYNMGLSTYNYKNELFSFGGLNFKYFNRYKNFDYEIGKVKGLEINKNSVASQIIGIQVNNGSDNKESCADINGYVDKENIIKVLINNNVVEYLNTYDGYYTLKDLKYNLPINKVDVYKVDNDENETLLLSKDFIPVKKKKSYGLALGVSGYNNRLFSQNGYIYEANSKKYVLAAQDIYSINDNISLKSTISMDKIYSKTKNPFMLNFNSSDALVSSGTWKNPNRLEGITNINNLILNQNKNLKHTLDFGLSLSKNIDNSNLNFGYTIGAATNYKNKYFNLGLSVFNDSTNYYLAGADGGFLSDRLGASLNFGIIKNGYNLNLEYKKYLSNLNKQYNVGLLYFDDYRFNFNKNFRKFAGVKLDFNGRKGQNNNVMNYSYYYDFSLIKYIKKLSLSFGLKGSNYTSEYFDKSNNDFKSLYSNIYGKMDYQLPKNLGRISLGDEKVSYHYSGVETSYDMFKLGYTFPEIKRCTLSLGVGYKYLGNEEGCDLFANLAVRTKSGRLLNFNYQYIKSGGYMFNNMFLPTSNRHSFNIVLNDAFAILGNNIKSIGIQNSNLGYVEAVAYIDKNNNGKFDKKDIKLSKIPIKCSWLDNDLYTKKNGKIISDGVDSGIYKVHVDLNKLPVTLQQEKQEQSEKLVKIDSTNKTRVCFPLKSIVGNIQGTLKIVDDFGRQSKVEDYIVVLLDENNKEVAYTTVLEDGVFNFSGIEPGKYILKLDDSFISNNNLADYEDKSSLIVEIPYKYKNFVDIKNQNLIYKTLF